MIDRREVRRAAAGVAERFKVTRVGAAYALRAAAGWKTNDRKLLTRETAKALPQRPLAALELIHGPLAVYPPKPLILPRDLAKAPAGLAPRPLPHPNAGVHGIGAAARGRCFASGAVSPLAVRRQNIGIAFLNCGFTRDTSLQCRNDH